VSRIKQFALKVGWFAVIALSMPGVAGAAGVNQYIGFGDSDLDSGYFRYNLINYDGLDSLIAAAVAAGDTGACVANGVMNSTILAGKFGLTAAPVGDPGGGTNYANSGSTTAINAQLYPGNVSTIQQIQNYLASVSGTANPNALYVIQSGLNDLSYSGPTPLQTYLSNSASALASEVVVLQAAGARTIMVTNSYNSAILAGLGGDIDPGNAAAYATSVAYFSLRWADLQAAGVSFIPADLDSVFRYVVHNPTLFGFTASSVLTVNAPANNNPYPYNIALFAFPLTSAQQQSFLFVDDLGHMTTAGQTIEADYEYSLLTAPSEISLVVENAVQSNLTRAVTVQGQIDLSRQSRGPRGINVWASTGAGWQSIDNASGFPNDPGALFGGTVGMDYQTQSGVILGAAFSADGQMQNFSTGGRFDQTDEAPSLYAAYKTGPVWGDVVATYDPFQDKIDRQVPLGIFTDDNNANTGGYSLALALRGGGDFKLGQITTGPVAGVVLQQVHLDGFTETGTSGVTALSFDSQIRDSFVSQIGWRVLVDIGSWQPFVEVKWNHEWADRNNTVTASLVSVAAPSYTMDAAPVAFNWATTSVGTSFKLNSRVTLRGAFLATFLNPQVRSYGGELGLNVSF
jgi:outer membrane lipase/esterase